MFLLLWFFRKTLICMNKASLWFFGQDFLLFCWCCGWEKDVMFFYGFWNSFSGSLQAAGFAFLILWMYGSVIRRIFLFFIFLRDGLFWILSGGWWLVILQNAPAHFKLQFFLRIFFFKFIFSKYIMRFSILLTFNWALTLAILLISWVFKEKLPNLFTWVVCVCVLSSFYLSCQYLHSLCVCACVFFYFCVINHKTSIKKYNRKPKFRRWTP